MEVVKKFNEWRMTYHPGHVFRGRVVEYKNEGAPYGIEISHSFKNGGPFLMSPETFEDYDTALFELAGHLYLLTPENAIEDKSYAPDVD
jgi:hypothetical protein